MKKHRQNIGKSIGNCMLEDTLSEHLWSQTTHFMWGKLGYTLLDRLRDRLWMQLMYQLKAKLWDDLEDFVNENK